MKIIDIFSEILIHLLIISFLIELVIAVLWLPIYYRKGIPVFKKRFKFDEKSLFLIDELANILASEFHRIFLPNLIFQSISEKEIAFNQRLKFRLYVLIMRGYIKIDNYSQQITLIGYVNWYVIWVICFFIFRLLLNPFNNILGLFFFVLIIFYIIMKFQVRTYSKVFKFLKKQYLQKF